MDEIYEISGFFHSDNGDREYDDDFLAEWVASFIGNGVYKSELAVLAGQGMSITLAPGRAWVKGRYYRNKPNRPAIPIENADGVYNRYASIMIRQNLNDRTNKMVVVYSEKSASPTPPAPVRNAEVYDIKLAHIYIPRGAVSVTQENITDTRLDTSVCGLVTGVVAQVPTETLYLQIQAELASFKANEEAAFNAWFAEVQEFLSEQEILKLKPMVEAIYPRATAQVSGNKVVVTSEQAKTGTDYDVQFNAPEAFNPARAYEIDGAAVTLKSQKNATLDEGAWSAGVPVTLTRRGANAFFKMGGGDVSPGFVLAGGATRPTNPADGTIWVSGATPGEIALLTENIPAAHDAIRYNAGAGSQMVASKVMFSALERGKLHLDMIPEWAIPIAALDTLQGGACRAYLVPFAAGRSPMFMHTSAATRWDVYSNGKWHNPGNILFYLGVTPYCAIGPNAGSLTYAFPAAANAFNGFGGLMWRRSATTGMGFYVLPNNDMSSGGCFRIYAASSQNTQAWVNLTPIGGEMGMSTDQQMKIVFTVRKVGTAGTARVGAILSPSTTFPTTGTIITNTAWQDIEVPVYVTDNYFAGVLASGGATVEIKKITMKYVTA